MCTSTAVPLRVPREFFILPTSYRAHPASPILHKCGPSTDYQMAPCISLSSYSHLSPARRSSGPTLSGRWAKAGCLHGSKTSREAQRTRPGDTKARPKPWFPFLALMGIESSILGPFLDDFHGRTGVLHYNDPLSVDIGQYHVLGTAAWVPLLFGLAGVIMSFLTVVMDEAFQTPCKKLQPAPPDVLKGISLFSFQYYISGVLAGVFLVNPVILNVSLLGLAVVCYLRFDRTWAGLTVGVLTSIFGPILELLLTTYTELYIYSSPDFYSVPSWIPWVYLCGGPAVCNLARAQWQALQDSTSGHEA